MTTVNVPIHLEKVRTERGELERRLADPDVYSQPDYREVAQRFSHLQDLIRIGEEWEKVAEAIAEMEELRQTEDDLRDELDEALGQDRERLESLSQEFRRLLVPPDPSDIKNAIVEIRAGAGGDESTLFAADLFRMYARFAEGRKWKLGLLDSHPTPIGGFRQLTFTVEGKGAYGAYRYESGVHRVQRVPETESQGRIHTSTASVVVLPEAEEVEIEIDPNDLRIDVFRSSGPGGQSVNTTDSAVRITHEPTGIVVSCQDEKSQHKNKAQAMRVLRARLHDRLEQEQQAELSAKRRSHIGSGDRSEKIRTYNFPQNRITDHRIGLSVHDLTSVLEGGLDAFVDGLRAAATEESLTE
ncbi:peptide chain release factor 1 [Candidatus Bipolaricaulota bacterium]